MKELGMTKDTSRDEDPTEAFLRHNEGAAANPYWTAPVYAKNQPVTLLADVHCEIRLLRGGRELVKLIGGRHTAV
jgi:hypothetical protein